MLREICFMLLYTTPTTSKERTFSLPPFATTTTCLANHRPECSTKWQQKVDRVWPKTCATRRESHVHTIAIVPFRFVLLAFTVECVLDFLCKDFEKREAHNFVFNFLGQKKISNFTRKLLLSECSQSIDKWEGARQKMY